MGTQFIRLIDGPELAALMIENDVGVITEMAFAVKKPGRQLLRRLLTCAMENSLTGDHKKHLRYFRRARPIGADEGMVEIRELLREFDQKTWIRAETAELG